jgi:RIO kinase 1
MHRLYVDCKLVHGDLSEFNILYLDGHCWLIDVSQSVDVSHANALPYLVRDIRNMLKFFGRTLDDELPDAQTIFNEITGITFDVDNFDEKVQQYADDQRYEQRREDKMSPADCLLRQCIEEAV